jgi:hypothetical protein
MSDVLFVSSAQFSLKHIEAKEIKIQRENDILG